MSFARLWEITSPTAIVMVIFVPPRLARYLLDYPVWGGSLRTTSRSVREPPTE